MLPTILAVLHLAVALPIGLYSLLGVMTILDNIQWLHSVLILSLMVAAPGLLSIAGMFAGCVHLLTPRRGSWLAFGIGITWLSISMAWLLALAFAHVAFGTNEFPGWEAIFPFVGAAYGVFSLYVTTSPRFEHEFAD